MNLLRTLTINKIILSILLSCVAWNVQASGDIKKGQGIAKRVCAACHGKQGISRAPVFPNLSGQKETYLIKQLKDFKAGTRASNNMEGVVKNLSEQDINDVAAFFAAHGQVQDNSAKISKSIVKKVDAKLNICMPCHNNNGISTNDQYPNLAGQKDRYLQKELEKFKKGKRKDPIMTGIAAQLDKNDMKNLSKYFSKVGKITIK